MKSELDVQVSDCWSSVAQCFGPEPTLDLLESWMSSAKTSMNTMDESE